MICVCLIPKIFISVFVFGFRAKGKAALGPCPIVKSTRQIKLKLIELKKQKKWTWHIQRFFSFLMLALPLCPRNAGKHWKNSPTGNVIFYSQQQFSGHTVTAFNSRQNQTSCFWQPFQLLFNMTANWFFFFLNCVFPKSRNLYLGYSWQQGPFRVTGKLEPILQ